MAAQSALFLPVETLSDHFSPINLNKKLVIISHFMELYNERASERIKNTRDRGNYILSITDCE